MTPYQVEEVKRIMIERYHSGTNYHIPEALFRLVNLHGLSLNKAKQLFLEVARGQDWVFIPSSIGAITWGAVDGKRGDDRILKWYIRLGGVWQTHFQIVGGGNEIKTY